jgi:hypothetical protein
MWSGRKLGIMKTLGLSQICHLDRSVAQWRDLRFRRLCRIEAYAIFTNDNRPGWNLADDFFAISRNRLLPAKARCRQGGSFCLRSR